MKNNITNAIQKNNDRDNFVEVFFDLGERFKLINENAFADYLQTRVEEIAKVIQRIDTQKFPLYELIHSKTIEHLSVLEIELKKYLAAMRDLFENLYAKIPSDKLNSLARDNRTKTPGKPMKELTEFNKPIINRNYVKYFTKNENPVTRYFGQWAQEILDGLNKITDKTSEADVQIIFLLMQSNPQGEYHNDVGLNKFSKNKPIGKPITKAILDFIPTIKWEISITFSNYENINDISFMLWTLTESFNNIGDAKVVLQDIYWGSLIVKLKVFFKDIYARIKGEDILNKGIMSAISYIEKPGLDASKVKIEVENIKANTENTFLDTEQKGELFELQKKKLNAEISNLNADTRLKNIETLEKANELIKEGILKVNDIEISINDIQLLFKSGANLKKLHSMIEIEAKEKTPDNSEFEVQV